MFFRVIFVFALSVTFIACSGSSNSTTNKITKFPVGRNLYISKCTSCHKSYKRELHTFDEWTKILKVMGNKAKLTTVEKDSILNYLSEKN